jgi:Ca2+-binding EF-hand superfamily protein
MKMLSIILFTVCSYASIAYAENDPVRSQFNQLDNNGDGILTRAELEARPELVRYSNFYAQGSFRLADINRDNQIDFREFEAHEEVIPY